LAVIVDKNVSWQEISDLVSSADKLIESVEYLSTFIDISIGADKKSLAFRLVFRLSDRTLKSEEVSEAVKKIITKLEEKFKAKLR
jgi:phenylalanyl-tRNA synthetase beta chain